MCVIIVLSIIHFALILIIQEMSFAWFSHNFAFYPSSILYSIRLDSSSVMRRTNKRWKAIFPSFMIFSFFFTIFYLTHKAQNKCLFKWSNYLYHMLKNQVRRLSRWLFRFLFFFISTAIHPFKVVYSFSVFSENETFSCRVCEYNLSKKNFLLVYDLMLVRVEEMS